MVTLSLNIGDLEPVAAKAMLDGLSAGQENPFFVSLAGALKQALHKPSGKDEKPPVVQSHLRDLDDARLVEVIAVFAIFAGTFRVFGLKRALDFCTQIGELALAEQVARHSRPGRFTPTLN